jgi:hypothetical protein
MELVSKYQLAISTRRSVLPFSAKIITIDEESHPEAPKARQNYPKLQNNNDKSEKTTEPPHTAQ